MFYYPSKTGIAKHPVEMNMKKQIPIPLRYVESDTAWAIQITYTKQNERYICPYPSTFEIGDFVFRIKQKTLSMLSSAISPAEHLQR